MNGKTKTIISNGARWIIPVLVTIAIFMLADLRAATNKQETRIQKSEISIAVLEEQYKSFDKKLDRILEKLEK